MARALEINLFIRPLLLLLFYFFNYIGLIIKWLKFKLNEYNLFCVLSVLHVNPVNILVIKI